MKCNRARLNQDKGLRYIMDALHDNIALILCVLHDEYGFGEKRLNALMDGIGRYCGQMTEWLRDEVDEQKMQERRNEGFLPDEKRINEFLKMRAKQFLSEENYNELFTSVGVRDVEQHQRNKRKQIDAKAIKPNEAIMLAKNVDMMSEFLKNQSFGASQTETLLKNAQ
ncbi:MAG: hypothetical protein U0K91_10910 [Acutalibacteraceae bacterium]|nr:hypothetical protein [Acutalibacteraceae bacterium]